MPVTPSLFSSPTTLTFRTAHVDAQGTENNGSSLIATQATGETELADMHKPAAVRALSIPEILQRVLKDTPESSEDLASHRRVNRFWRLMLSNKIKISNLMHRIKKIDELETEEEKIEAVMKIVKTATDYSGTLDINSTPLSSREFASIFLALMDQLRFSMSKDSMGKVAAALLKSIGSIENEDVKVQIIGETGAIFDLLTYSEWAEPAFKQLVDIALDPKIEKRRTRMQAIDEVTQILDCTILRNGNPAVHDAFGKFIAMAKSMDYPHKDDNDAIKHGLIRSLIRMILHLKPESRFEALKELARIVEEIENEEIRAQAIGDLINIDLRLLQSNAEKAILLIEELAATITNGTQAKTSVEDTVIIMRMDFDAWKKISSIRTDADPATRRREYSANLTVLRGLVKAALGIRGDTGKVQSIKILTEKFSSLLSQDGIMECFRAQLAIIHTIRNEKNKAEGMDNLWSWNRYEEFKPEDLNEAVDAMKNLAESFSNEDARMMADGAYSLVCVSHSLCIDEMTGSNLARLVRTNTALFRNKTTYPTIVQLLAEAIDCLHDFGERDEPFRVLLHEFAIGVEDDKIKYDCIMYLADYAATISPYQDTLILLQKITNTLKNKHLKSLAIEEIRYQEEYLRREYEGDDTRDLESEDDLPIMIQLENG